MFARAQVPCTHAVSIARAAIENDPLMSPPILRQFANLSLTDAESGAHEVFVRAGFAAPVKIDCEDLGDHPDLKSWPFVKFSSWLSYLIDSKRAPSQLCGVRTENEMHSRLRVFWRRFQALHPEHEVFERARRGEILLSHAIPVWSHTDEGRTKKRLALLVISVHGCLGRGTRQYLEEVERNPGKRDSLGLNFVGPTWSTQFLFTTMMRTVYNKHPQALEKIVEIFAEDMSMCARQGVASILHPEKVYYAVQLGTKGDLPALIKLGSFKRTYSRVPKTAHSRTECAGICHICDAGKEGQNPVLFEDLSPQPGWVNSCYVNPPWNQEPRMLMGQLLEPSRPSFFFRLDIWHNFHCGVARVWLASCFIVLCNLGIILGGSVDQRFKNLTDLYREFCGRNRLSMHIVEFTRDNLGFDSEASWPVGKWNKGAASTHMMLFLEQFLEERVVGRTADALLLALVACHFLIEFFSCSHSCVTLVLARFSEFEFQFCL